jgi:hypothetical protein
MVFRQEPARRKYWIDDLALASYSARVAWEIKLKVLPESRRYPRATSGEPLSRVL